MSDIVDIDELTIVVPCAFDNRFNDIIQNVTLLRKFNPYSIIMIIVDRNQNLYTQLNDNLQIKHENTQIISLSKSNGLSSVRNFSIKQCNTKYIAFIDDDALPTLNWAKNLVFTMNKYENAIGAGGPIYPLKTKNQKYNLPHPLLWIWGCTYFLFNKSQIIPVSNNFGSNMIFQTKLITKIKFPDDLATNKFTHQGGEEYFVCQKLRENFDGNIYFNPNAIVFHRIYNTRYKVSFIFKRVYLESLSKSKMRYKHGLNSPNSKKLIDILLSSYLPFLFSKLIKLENIKQVFYELGILTIFSVASLIGMIKGRLK